MKKSFLKFLLSFCILLSSICSPLFANLNIGDTSFYTLDQQFTNSAHSNLEIGFQNQNAIIKGSLDEIDKILEIDATEIEEESENSFFKNDEELNYTSASLYLLSLLFLFSYLKNSNTLQRLFVFFPLFNRRFVLYQVFRL